MKTSIKICRSLVLLVLIFVCVWVSACNYGGSGSSKQGVSIFESVYEQYGLMKSDESEFHYAGNDKGSDYERLVFARLSTDEDASPNVYVDKVDYGLVFHWNDLSNCEGKPIEVRYSFIYNRNLKTFTCLCQSGGSKLPSKGKILRRGKKCFFEMLSACACSLNLALPDDPFEGLTIIDRSSLGFDAVLRE